MNEDYRQLQIANEVAQAARILAHSTRSVPKASDSYELLGELRSSIDHLERVLSQIAEWHAGTYENEHLRAVSPDGQVPAATDAADALRCGANALGEAHKHMDTAFTANGSIRWSA